MKKSEALFQTNLVVKALQKNLGGKKYQIHPLTAMGIRGKLGCCKFAGLHNLLVGFLQGLRLWDLIYGVCVAKIEKNWKKGRKFGQ